MGNAATNCGESARFGLNNGHLQEENQQNLVAYPKPASNLLEFEVLGIDEPMMLKIISLTGQEVYRATLDKTFSGKIDISGFPKGVYVLRATSASHQIQKKTFIRVITKL